MDLNFDSDCFKVLPPGCSYSNTATDFYSSLCKGYQTLPEKIHTSLIKLSINTELNPLTQSVDFAECIKKHINTFSVQMECALEGVAMDHTYAIEKLGEYAEKLTNAGYINVKVDPDTLNLTYEEEVVESEHVEVEKEDFISSGGAIAPLIN